MNILRVVSNRFIRSGPVSIQPGGTYYFENTFAPLSGEHIRRTYECQEGCSGCCGPKTTIALTDTRIISRRKEANQCCCCIEGAHVDTNIFLYDIGLIRETKQRSTNLCGALLLSCLTGTCLCFLLTLCCGSCCGDQPKILEVSGGFGSEYLIFKQPEAGMAANDITSMLVPMKKN